MTDDLKNRQIHGILKFQNVVPTAKACEQIQFQVWPKIDNLMKWLSNDKSGE